MIYEAVVKYAIDDPPEHKRRALEEGIGYVVALLMDEHDVTAARIEELLEAAIDNAYDTEAEREVDTEAADA